MQGISTVGGCRYRQAIPVGSKGRLDVDTNLGLRKGFLPQVWFQTYFGFYFSSPANFLVGWNFGAEMALFLIALFWVISVFT